MPTTDAIRQQLATVKYPGFSRDIISFGLVKDIVITGTEVTVQLTITAADAKIPAQIKAEAEAAIRTLPDVTKAVVRVDILSEYKRCRALYVQFYATRTCP